MPKPLAIQEPYPTLDGITPDAHALRIISPAYASARGELNAILQYIYHSFFFEKQGKQDIADTLVGIAIAEMRHIDLLGGTILALGAAPVYALNPATSFNFYSTKSVAYSCTLKNMLEDDLLAEKHAVASYEKMLKCLRNERVKAIIARILEDEKLHVKILEEILSNFKC